VAAMTSNSLDFTARCLAASVKKAISDQLGDTSIKIISKEEYDSIEHDANTIYYVRDGGKITQYIGDIKLTVGTASGNLTFALSSNYGYIIGDLQEEGEQT
jgi:hypothetical protein